VAILVVAQAPGLTAEEDARRPAAVRNVHRRRPCPGPGVSAAELTPGSLGAADLLQAGLAAGLHALSGPSGQEPEGLHRLITVPGSTADRADAGDCPMSWRSCISPSPRRHPDCMPAGLTGRIR
jgi:hypothetical protein